jgi:ABC-type uncharacterized transport system permease subunit
MLVYLYAWFAALGYAVATALLVRRLRAGGRDATRPARRTLALAALACMAHVAYHSTVVGQIGGMDMHFFAALSQVGLGMAIATVVIAWLKPVESIGVVVFPLAALLLLVDVFAVHPRVSAGAHSWQIALHATNALFAYALLSIAAVVAGMLVFQEGALRRRRVGGLLRWFPPLTLVEGLLFQVIIAGFALLTLTLVTGVLFVDNLFAQALVHKTVLSIAAWVVFGTLLFGRWHYGWRGRRAATLTLSGMGLLLLAFVGSKFVLEFLLQRT